MVPPNGVCRGAGRIDVNEVVVARHLGELVDPLLRHRLPFGGAELQPDGRGQLD